MKCQQATARPRFPGQNLRSDRLLVDLQGGKEGGVKFVR